MYWSLNDLNGANGPEFAKGAATIIGRAIERGSFPAAPIIPRRRVPPRVAPRMGEGDSRWRAFASLALQAPLPPPTRISRQRGRGDLATDRSWTCTANAITLVYFPQPDRKKQSFFVGNWYMARPNVGPAARRATCFWSAPSPAPDDRRAPAGPEGPDDPLLRNR